MVIELLFNANKRYTKSVLALGSLKKTIISLSVAEMGTWAAKGTLYEWNHAGIIGVQKEKKEEGDSSSSAVL